MANDNKQSYGIAAALSEALEAAVYADSTAANKAYEMIEKYAYGEDFEAVTDDDSVASMNTTGKADSNDKQLETVGSTELAKVTFSMRDNSGMLREFTIPKITMMPLPLLHVTEANFEIEMKATVVSANNAEEATMTSPTTTDAATVKRPTSSSVTRNALGVVVRRTADGRLVRQAASARQSANDATAAIGMTSSAAITTNQQMVVSTKATTSDANASTINMKVNIKMEQAELPEGIKLMLQAAANNMQVSTNMPIGGNY